MTEAERRTGTYGLAAEVLAAELALIRQGIVEAGVTVGERVPALVGAVLRGTDLAGAGAALVGSSIDRLDATLGRLTGAIQAVEVRMAEVAVQAATDVLTGVLNRSAVERALAQAIAAADAAGEPLSLMFCDIDHFKEFNDRHGHDVGDHALRLVANTLSAYPDGRRLVGRYGGEEFVMVMPGHDAAAAVAVASTVTEALDGRELRMRSTGEPLGAVTLSAGVAERRPGETGAALLRRADAAMYLAKRSGRNRVVLAA